MKNIKIFYDVETTGVDPRKHSIHQIAMLIEVDGVVVKELDIKTKPHPKAEIDPEALKIGNVDEDTILNYPNMKSQYKYLLMILDQYMDRFDRNDKAWLIGFNNRSFDDVFLRKWFEQNKDPFFNSWFWPDTQDVLCLASVYLMDRRRKMANFKLKTVAKEVGVFVQEEKLHDAFYDVVLTKEIYEIVTGIEEEL